MKSIYLNGRFLTQPLTGVQRVAFELVTALDSLLDHDNTARDHYRFILIYSGKLINPIKLQHIQLLKKGVLTGNLWEQIELPFYTFGHLLLSMCTISCLLKTKQIVIVHDASFVANPGFFPYIFRTWYKYAVRLLGITARQIITVSQFSKAELVSRVGLNSHMISVIYNSSEHIMRFADPEDSYKKRIINYKPYCLAVSSLGANKNFAGLSQAIRKIDFKYYHMLIAGGAMATLQQERPDPIVTYLGYVSNEELKFLYQNAALFIFPSFYEGFGIPPLEAMICGCPVLSSNTSSLPEVLGEACVFCDPANVDDIAAKIDELINNEVKLNAFKAKGYRQASKYSWKESALQMFAILQKYA